MPRVDRYGIVLALLVVSYFVLALGGGSMPRILEGSTAILATWFAFLASAVDPRIRRAVLVMLVLAFVAVVVVTQSLADRTARGVSEVWFVVVFLLTLLAVLRRVLTHREVTLETICGALSAYILLGLMFTSAYGAIADLGDQQLFVQVAEPSIALRQYFSFTTLTTLGYGDVTAATDLGRGIATLEAICGQIFLATLIARLVASFVGRRRHDEPG